MTPRFFIYLSLLIIVVSYGLLNFKKISVSSRYLVLLVGCTFISETLSGNGFAVIPNLALVYHILLPLTMLFLWLIFSRLINNYRKIDFIVTMCAFFLALINSMFYQTNIFPSIGLSLLCNVAVWLSLQTFKQMINWPTSVSLIKRPEFWLALATLSFYLITFFYFTFYNSYKVVLWLDSVNYFANWTLYLGYFLVLILDVKNKSTYATT
jgi:hypothetical protein